MRWRVLLGTAIPLVIMCTIGIILLAQGDAEQARGTFAVGVIAAAVSGAAFIYQIDGWSLTKQSVVHSLVMLVTVLPALLLSGWFDLSSPEGWLTALLLYVAWGVGLWVIFYLIFTLVDRHKARRTETTDRPTP